MNTKIEVPKRHKAVVEHFILDESSFILIKVEPKDPEEIEEHQVETQIPEWEKFKRGDVLVSGDVLVLFDEYHTDVKTWFSSLVNSSDKLSNYNWKSELFTRASDQQKYAFSQWLRDERGLVWDGDKLVEVPKNGDWVILWDYDPTFAGIFIYGHYCKDNQHAHFTNTNANYIHAIKWDGTREQFEKVLNGEIK